MESNTLSIKSLKKDFKNNTIFHDVSVDFISGKIYGIAGRNGTGKSVFFKIICGLMSPTEGQVTYNGKIIGKDMDYLGDAGIIIENPNFLDNYSGYKNLEYLISINKKVNMDLAEKYIDLLEMREYINKKVKTYSLGMKQKLGFVQAVMEDQNVVILDEPFNGLDEQSVDKVRTLILELKEKGKLVLLSSHIKEDIEKVCDEVYQFNNFTLNKIENSLVNI